MRLVYILIILQVQPLQLQPFNMYNTDPDQNQDGYCLLYYAADMLLAPEKLLTYIHQIISYCFRPSEETKHIFNVSFNNTIDTVFNFGELRERNISSQILLSWSASIDLAERYQTFLDDVSNTSFMSKILFYNCTFPWFGPYCGFTFDIDSNDYLPLNNIVSLNFKRAASLSINKVPCYKHLECKTTFLCLDWREICDRKIDCLDGSDELHCWELEINDCAENEYGCHNGQCISIEFVNDIPESSDCLDQTDMTVLSDNSRSCPFYLTFRCEEHTCPSIFKDFPCGDGQCTDQLNKHCDNGRSNLLRNEFSSNATVCLDLDQYRIISYGSCNLFDAYNLYEFPVDPIVLGHVRFVFESATDIYTTFPLPTHVCYDEQLCQEFLSPTLFWNGTACRPFIEIGLNRNNFYLHLDTLLADVKAIFRKCLVVLNETHYCNYSTMYQCMNSSKCISKYRLLDGIKDCPFNDDETFNQSCSLNNKHYRIKCWVSADKSCFAPIVLYDGKYDCPAGEDELSTIATSSKKHINYQTICNGKTDLFRVFIDDQYETDETDCANWPCNNTYSRCDTFWHCQNGADEVNCPPSTCPILEHECVFPNDISKVSCLPITRAGDGMVDCIGGIDERYYCQKDKPIYESYSFRCRNDTICIYDDIFCDGRKDCLLDEDEIICWNNSATQAQRKIVNFLRRSIETSYQPSRIYFILYNMPKYAVQSITDTTTSLSISMSTKFQSIQSSSSIIDSKTTDNWRCNRGLRIYLRMNNNITRSACLCPPSYYGDSCEYQNQRVSLTLKIRATSDWRTVFTFVVTLIDNEENIESYDHIDYLAMRDCNVKFNIYLLYSTRPKNLSKNYLVRIHAFNKVTLKYRTSWIFPLRFPFLPVHRLPVFLTSPMYDAEPIQNCLLPCIHGQCFRYVNDQNSTFCRCKSGWSGIQCTEKYPCDCAFNFSCIDKSICVCPLGRFGPQCRLIQSSCHSYSCSNGGECVPVDERYLPRHLVKPTCICREGFFGDKCEIEERSIRIDISFHKEISIPSSLFLHFITVQETYPPNQTTIMKKIGFDEDILTIYTSISFNIAFSELVNNYYLIILREQLIVSANISTHIVPSHRCVSIHELFNVTLANQHLLKRIKYYHIPCQERLDLVCFYDSVHFCLCDLARQTNCFEFNHNETYNCSGHSWCENESHCFLDNPMCPTSSICACHRCYFGSKCQFSTKGSTLSLDIILGYRIISNIGINQQPAIIKIAVIVTTLMFVLGLISNVFAFLVFRIEETRKVGCGIYLFISSINSMITMSVFTLKLGLLLGSNIGGIKNRSFVQVQCISIDFILRVLLSSGDWLNACVSIERAVNILKGVNFNKSKSKKIAKWIIPIVFSFVICTHIHDPIHRRLIDDNDEQRTWCITQYSSSIQIFDWIINIFHFLIPFTINCISALAIIIIAARTRTITQKKRTYKQVLREQFHQHKHLLISSSILVILALPRIIISFLSGCMNSIRDSSFYLTGYFISFIPPMLTFIIFVLPSQMYRKQFNDVIKKISVICR